MERQSKQISQVIADETTDNTKNEDKPTRIVASTRILSSSGDIGNSKMGCWVQENGDGSSQFVVIDTGAQVSCYDNDSFRQRHPGVPIHQAEVDLVSVDNKKIPSYGYGSIFITNIVLSDGRELPITPTIVDYYLLDGLKYPVLSDEDASNLNILRWMQQLFDSNKIPSALSSDATREIGMVRRRDLTKIDIPDDIFDLIQTLH